MSKTGPIQFIQEVRNEVSKVTWPSRGETLTTTLIVFIFCLIAAIFFFLGDQIMSFGIKLIAAFPCILEAHWFCSCANIFLYFVIKKK